MAGLSATGFSRLRLADIKKQIEEKLRSKFGKQIDLTPPSIWSEIVGIFSEREDALWEALQALADSRSPGTAEGVALDNVVSLTGITRLGETKSRQRSLHLIGAPGTVVPAGTQVSVDGNPDAQFLTLTDSAPLGTGEDAEQLVSFSGIPVTGSFKLVYEEEVTASIPYTADDAAVESALNALAGLSEVNVTGNFATGFSINFTGADGLRVQPLLTFQDNTLGVTVTITEVQAGAPQATVDAEAVLAGAVQAPAGTLTVIDTPVTGLDGVVNVTDAEVGRSVEGDLDLRRRRQNTLQVAGNATPDAIRSRLLELDGVTAVSLFENDDDVPDIDGRPGHSYEAVVQGGDEQNIANTIWSSKPGGIRTHGSRLDQVTDSQGFTQNVRWSRPTGLPIYVAVELVVTGAYPQDGDDQVKEAIAARGNLFGIGGDVIVSPVLICALDEIPGIINAIIKVSTAPGPTLSDPIPVGPQQIAEFDTSRIGVSTSS